VTATQCYICNKNLEQPPAEIWGNGLEVDCKVCGKYIRRGPEILRTLAEEKRCLLSGCIREINEFNKEDKEPPKIYDEQDINNIFSSVKIPTTMLEKAYKIIPYLVQKTASFGEEVKVNSEDGYPIAYAKNATEFIRLLTYLTDRGYVKSIRDGSGLYSLTMQGWQKFEEIESRQPDSKQCFVAMSFDPSLYDIYEQGIKKAIKEAGYEPIRSDRQEHNEKICDKIMADIRKSRFIVADVTKQNQGAYFEAGFALGLNITVIWLCEQKEIDEKKLHFDTQQFKHIGWTNPEDLYTKLLARINATIV